MEQNKNDMFEDMRAGGSKLPDMVEYLKANGWKTYNHHDNWVKEGMSGEYDTHEAYNKQLLQAELLKCAVQMVIEALKQDEGYYESWKANIAMAMYDEYTDNHLPQAKVSHGDIHEIANSAADRFLRLLTAEKTTDNG